MEILELKKYVYEIKTALTGQIEMVEESQNQKLFSLKNTKEKKMEESQRPIGQYQAI